MDVDSPSPSAHSDANEGTRSFRPIDFPAALPEGWYDFPEDPDTDPVEPPPIPAAVNPSDRRWTSLYDVNLLAGRPDKYAKREMGVLRKKWRNKFQQNGNGVWNYVEYVPAVSPTLQLSKSSWPPASVRMFADISGMMLVDGPGLGSQLRLYRGCPELRCSHSTVSISICLIVRIPELLRRGLVS